MNSCNILLSPDPSFDLSEPGLDGDVHDNDTRMVNHLSTGSPRYITDIVGRPREFYHYIDRNMIKLMDYHRLSRTHVKLVTDNAAPPSQSPLHS